jgi:hypothetical protein
MRKSERRSRTNFGSLKNFFSRTILYRHRPDQRITFFTLIATVRRISAEKLKVPFSLSSLAPIDSSPKEEDLSTAKVLPRSFWDVLTDDFLVEEILVSWLGCWAEKSSESNGMRIGFVWGRRGFTTRLNPPVKPECCGQIFNV